MEIRTRDALQLLDELVSEGCKLLELIECATAINVRAQDQFSLIGIVRSHDTAPPNWRVLHMRLNAVPTASKKWTSHLNQLVMIPSLA
jgi:hypothetical protein